MPLCVSRGSASCCGHTMLFNLHVHSMTTVAVTLIAIGVNCSASEANGLCVSNSFRCYREFRDYPMSDRDAVSSDSEDHSRLLRISLCYSSETFCRTQAWQNFTSMMREVHSGQHFLVALFEKCWFEVMGDLYDVLMPEQTPSHFN